MLAPVARASCTRSHEQHGPATKPARRHPAGRYQVTGIGFVPAGGTARNEYADGAWLAPGGYDRLFRGAHYPLQVPPRAAGDPASRRERPRAVARRLHAAAARAGDPGLTYTPPDPLPDVQAIQDLQALPLALSAFLDPAGHRRGRLRPRPAPVRHCRRHELAVHCARSG